MVEWEITILVVQGVVGWGLTFIVLVLIAEKTFDVLTKDCTFYNLFGSAFDVFS